MCTLFCSLFTHNSISICFLCYLQTSSTAVMMASFRLPNDTRFKQCCLYQISAIAVLCVICQLIVMIVLWSPASFVIYQVVKHSGSQVVRGQKIYHKCNIHE